MNIDEPIPAFFSSEFQNKVYFRDKNASHPTYLHAVHYVVVSVLTLIASVRDTVRYDSVEGNLPET